MWPSKCLFGRFFHCMQYAAGLAGLYLGGGGSGLVKGGLLWRVVLTKKKIQPGQPTVRKTGLFTQMSPCFGFGAEPRAIARYNWQLRRAVLDTFGKGTGSTAARSESLLLCENATTQTSAKNRFITSSSTRVHLAYNVMRRGLLSLSHSLSLSPAVGNERVSSAREA